MDPENHSGWGSSGAADLSSWAATGHRSGTLGTCQGATRQEPPNTGMQTAWGSGGVQGVLHKGPDKQPFRTREGPLARGHMQSTLPAGALLRGAGALVVSWPEVGVRPRQLTDQELGLLW